MAHLEVLTPHAILDPDLRTMLQASGDEMFGVYSHCPEAFKAFLGFDHGVGHSLLLLYDVKTPHGQKVKEFNGLWHDPSNTSLSLL